MADKLRRHRLYKLISLFFLVIAALVLILVSLDYLTYKSGSRSHLFGTLNNYNQNQTLEFGNLDLKITSVKLKQYANPPAPTTTNCDALSASLSPTSRLDPNVFSPRGICEGANENNLSDYQDALNYIKSNKGLVVTFSYWNVSNKTLDLSRYKTKLIINTPFAVSPNSTVDGIRPSCSGLPRASLLKGSVESSCLADDIKNGYQGPLVMSVTSQGKEKIINLQL